MSEAKTEKSLSVLIDGVTITAEDVEQSMRSRFATLTIRNAQAVPLLSPTRLDLYRQGDRQRLEAALTAADAMNNGSGEMHHWPRIMREALGLIDAAIVEGRLFVLDGLSSKASASTNKAKKTPVVIRLSDVEPETIDWLWYPYIPAGKLTLMDGDPGVGKSILSTKISAMVTVGEAFPKVIPEYDAPPVEPGNVIYVGIEDGLADTMRPRLAAAYGEADRFYAVRGATDESGDAVSISLKDLEFFRELLIEYTPRLMIIDPIMGFMGSGTNEWKTSDVNMILHPISLLAEEFNCAIIGIRHLTKDDKGGKSIYRGTGSISFMGAARSAILIGKDPENHDRIIIAHSKHNASQRGPSLAYQVVEELIKRSDGSEMAAPRVKWDGESSLTAEDLCAPPIRGDQEEERSAMQEAKDFLMAYLSDGPKEVNELKTAARKATISERTLRRAKAELDIVSRAISEDGKRGVGKWVWEFGSEVPF